MTAMAAPRGKASVGCRRRIKAPPRLSSPGSMSLDHVDACLRVDHGRRYSEAVLRAQMACAKVWSRRCALSVRVARVNLTGAAPSPCWQAACVHGSMRRRVPAAAATKPSIELQGMPQLHVSGAEVMTLTLQARLTFLVPLRHASRSNCHSSKVAGTHSVHRAGGAGSPPGTCQQRRKHGQDPL